MYAVVDIGNKLFKIEKGAELIVDKLENKQGDVVNFNTVTLYRNDKEILIGKPYLSQVTVEGQVVEPLVKGEKVVIFKYKQKANYRRKKGHRQEYSKIKITDIKKS